MPDGTPVQLPPPVAFQMRGPCLQVTINLSASVAAQLVQQGVAVPAPMSGTALIDTGASLTCIDDVAAQRLGLSVIDVVSIASASHASTQQNVYATLIEITGTAISINADRAIGAALHAQGLIALIGRDVLMMTTIFYNGVTGEFTLSV